VGEAVALIAVFSGRRNLYVREDHLLDRIRGDRHLRRQLAELADWDADAVADELRANDAIIVCDHDTWAVESDTIRIELAPTTILGFAPPATPAQRPGTPNPNLNDHHAWWGNNVSEPDLNPNYMVLSREELRLA